METTLDRFGRVVIPKRVRDNLGLQPGAVLKIKQNNQKISLEPLDDEPRMMVRKGVLVFQGTATGDIEGAIKAHRHKRLSEFGSDIKK